MNVTMVEPRALANNVLQARMHHLQRALSALYTLAALPRKCSNPPNKWWGWGWLWRSKMLQPAQQGRHAERARGVRPLRHLAAEYGRWPFHGWGDNATLLD